MISVILIFLASICNAIIDNIKDHWYKSKFNKLNPKFWNPEISWKEGFIPNTKYHFDAWHLFKSTMIVLIIFSIIFYKVMINWYCDLLILGTIWNLTFNTFYNKILINIK